MDLTQIPFHSLLGLERSSKTGFVFSFPDDEKYTNHIGIVHASALTSLAEITSGECIVLLSKSLPFEIVPVVCRLETRFKHPAEGAIHSRYLLKDEEFETCARRLEARGKATLAVEVEVCTSNGQQVLTGTVNYFISKK
ncbi:PaaI family thioesterase [Pelagicoccus mobilis]|uniref:YiiD C-terminal domain-containing protein n=1 Tax=Pelagicoccus mobilis TaxID=415221 RepID=A0A934VL74_9BACT|nr:YiiD C-terminal domain-containing protein [Pelagicoccus mobilis]